MGLKQLRSEKGMTQQELAQQSGLRQATLSGLENGRTKAQSGTVTALAAALNCSVDQVRQALQENLVTPEKSSGSNKKERLFDPEKSLGDLAWNWNSAQRATNGPKKQWKEAMIFLDPILKRFPEFLEARKLMRHSSVQAALKIPLSDRIPPPQSYVGKAQKQVDEGNPLLAIETLEEKVFVYLPTNVEAGYVLSKAAEAGGLPDTARFALEFSASSNPDDKLALNRLADYYYHGEEFDLACEMLNRVKNIDPNDLDATKAHRDMAARASMKNGSINKKDFESALEVEHSQRIAITDEQKVAEVERLLNIYYSSKNSTDPDQAVEANAGLRRAVGLCRELGERSVEWSEKALELQQLLITEFPQDPVLVSQLDEITMLIHNKRIELADESDRAALQKERDQIQLEVAERAALGNPTSAELQLQLGKAYMDVQRFREAVGPLQQAKTDPRLGIDIEAMMLLSDCYMEGKLTDLALQEIEQALSKIDASGTNVDIQWLELKYKKAMLCLSLNKNEEAKALFAEIYSKDSGFKDVEVRVWGGGD